MKRYLLLSSFFSVLAACSPPNTVAKFQELCAQADLRVSDVCPDLTAVSATPNTFSKSAATTIAMIQLNRSLVSLSSWQTAWSPVGNDGNGVVVSDTLNYIKIKQDTSSTNYQLPASQIVSNETHVQTGKADLGDSTHVDKWDVAQGANELIITLLPSDLAGLTPGQPAALEVQVTDWQGIVRTSSVSITISA